MAFHNKHIQRRDPILAALLASIERDIASGRNVGDLPVSGAAALREAMRRVPVDLDERLEGEVAR